MTSNRCFCDRALVRENLRRNLWAVVLSAVGFFFTLPLPVAMRGQRLMQEVNDLANSMAYTTHESLLENACDDVATILGYDNFFVKIGVLIMAVVCGVLLFSYLHDRRRVDFYHALPISRTCLFGTRFVSGIVMVLPAYLVMELLAVGFAYGFGLGGGVVWSGIAKSLAVNVIFFLFIYAVSALCTVVTGNTVIAVLLDFWALGSLSAFVGIVSGYCSMFYDTFMSGEFLGLLATRLSPVLQYFSVFSDTAQSGYLVDGLGSGSSLRLVPLLVIYLIAAAAVMLLALWAFARRRSERSGTALAFEPVKPPIKVYMVAVLALAFGLFFYLVGGVFWMWFGLVAGVIISHIVVEIIYHFDFRAGLRHWKTLLVMIAAVCAAVGLMKADVTGYDNWVPAADTVQAVGVNLWTESVGVNGQQGMYTTNVPDLVSQENIERVCAMAEQAVGAGMNEESQDPQTPEDYRRYASVTVYYRMASGRVSARQYNGNAPEELLALYNALRFTEEYQRQRNLLFCFDLDAPLVVRASEQTPSMPFAQIRTGAVPDGGAASAEIRDREQLAALLDALRTETLALTAAQATTELPVLRIDLGWRSSSYSRTAASYVPVYASYTKTLALIRQFTGVEPEKLTPEQVREITITKIAEQEGDATESWYEDEYGRTVYYKEDSVVETEEQRVTVTDPLELAVLLENAITDGTMSAADRLLSICPGAEDVGYHFFAELNDGSGVTLYYKEGKLPTDLLTQYFGS